jgi:hypothetical protein
MNKLVMILGLALAVAAPAFADESGEAAGEPAAVTAPAHPMKKNTKHGKRGAKKSKKDKKAAAEPSMDEGAETK